MLRSRRRAASNPPPSRFVTTPTPTAALAASQAFLKSANSNASLSSAAAAAALRAHTPSPVPVGSIQTKRMQRKGSIASVASAPGVRRQPSSASMSERTFRSPSPSPRNRAPASVDAGAPPVPAIPNIVQPASQHRHVVGEALPNTGEPGDRRMAKIAEQAPHVPSEAKEEEISPASVNFSRPMSPRASPASSPTPPDKGRGGWFTGPALSEQKPRQDIRITAPVTALKDPSIDVSASASKVTSRPNRSHTSGSSRAGAISPESTQSVRTTSPQPPHLGPDLPPSPQSVQSPSLSDSSSDFEPVATRPKLPPLVRQPSTVLETPETETEEAVAPECPRETVSPQSQLLRDHSPKRDHRVGRVPESHSLRPTTKGSRPLQRHASLSPARSAHFAPAAVDTSTAIKHQPPLRSISPIKSAMKQSPPPSKRGTSPIISHAATQAQSDLSSDAGSYDGHVPSPRSKKAVRVSFDENVTRQAPSSPSPSPPIVVESSPRARRTLQGINDEHDETMSPRPFLPSFESIRRERRPVDEDIPRTTTGTLPPMSNPPTAVTKSTEAPVDRAAGSILAEDFETKKTAGHEPKEAPLNTTSGEDTVCSSDDTASSDDDSDSAAKEKLTVSEHVASNRDALPAIPQKGSAGGPSAAESMSVPQIAIQPATPAIDDQNQQPSFEMPGAWSDLDDELSDQGQFTPAVAPDDNSQADSSDEDDVVYTDAAEDPSELEGGFASLDAMIEKPVVAPPPSKQESGSVPESPPSKRQKKQSITSKDKPVTVPDWSDMEQSERPDGAQPANDTRPMPSKTVKRATVVPEPVIMTSESVPRTRNASKPKMSALQVNLRLEAPSGARNKAPVPKMRQSMRKSMANASTSPEISHHGQATTSQLSRPRGALQKRNVAPHHRGASVTSPPVANRVVSMPTLGRSLSDQSDASDSSFRRQRRTSPSYTDGKYKMRRSMRSGPSLRHHGPDAAPILRANLATPVATPKSARLSIRSLSPSGSLFGKRKPLAGDPHSADPTSAAPIQSLGTVKDRHSLRFQSRYEDSSDDGEGCSLPTFRSRYADSDNEADVSDLPTTLEPVRGIPRRAGDDGDSTELEDEASDVEGLTLSPPPSATQDIEHGAAAVTSGQGSGVKKDLGGSLRESRPVSDFGLGSYRKERRSIFSLGKKHDTSDLPPRARLHRRHSHGRRASDSWPLPSGMTSEKPGSAPDRPTLSHAIPSGLCLGGRQSSDDEVDESGLDPNAFREHGHKKKKFPMLRKAFGMKD